MEGKSAQRSPKDNIRFAGQMKRQQDEVVFPGKRKQFTRVEPKTERIIKIKTSKPVLITAALMALTTVIITAVAIFGPEKKEISLERQRITPDTSGEQAVIIANSALYDTYMASARKLEWKLISTGEALKDKELSSDRKDELERNRLVLAQALEDTASLAFVVSKDLDSSRAAQANDLLFSADTIMARFVNPGYYEIAAMRASFPLGDSAENANRIAISAKRAIKAYQDVSRTEDVNRIKKKFKNYLPKRP